MSELNETPTVTHDAPTEDVSRGDDGLTDDERRLAKQKARDREQEKVDRDGDAVRADQERANGEAEGARGRNAPTGERGPELDAGKGSPAKVTPRKAQGK